MPTNCRSMFTYEEDNKLKCLVSYYGTKNWYLISELMPGRNARQCKDRWEKYLDPNINFQPFTQEEDRKLLYLHKIIGPKKFQEVSTEELTTVSNQDSNFL